MIICPIQNSALFIKIDWKQSRSRKKITQKFGQNLVPLYRELGMKGHNGIDYGVRSGTPIFSPFSGRIRVRNDGRSGYGLHIKLRSRERKLEACLAHLSRSVFLSGVFVKTGDLIAWSGNSGYSTGPHLHVGLRRLIPASGNIFKWKVKNACNGYYGYFNHEKYTIEWKGSHFFNTI